MGKLYPDAYFDGSGFDAYRYFGAHHTKDGVVFRVCAPQAQSVALIGEWNGWQPIPMEKTDPRGIYTVCVDYAQPGQMYKFRIHEGGEGRVRDRADPFGRQTELRPGTASMIPPQQGFQFTDTAWRNAQNDGHYDRPLNIYEMHVGSWRRHPDGSFYGYRELAQSLVIYCKEHFYTHVEFLPLAEYPFDGSWGYQVSGYFSVTSRYGSPDDFRWLVNELHKANIGVIMDFVPVHFIPDDFALFEFDGTPLFEYSNDLGYSEWGSCNFDFSKPIVRSFLQSAADFWLTECHVDGLRFDAVRNIIYYQGDEARGENSIAIEALKTLNQGLKERHPHALLIAEDSTNFIKVTAPVQYDGLGFDYKWDLGWMNDTLAYFQLPPDMRYTPENYHKLTFSMSYFYDNLFLLPLSHDEVVHGKKTILDKMWGSYEQKFAQCRTLYTWVYTHPGKKLGFMGNEFASFREWDENRELDWQLLRYPIHSGFDRFLIGLAGLYRSCPALHEGEYHPGCFHWLEANDSQHAVYAYERAAGGDRLAVALNLSDKAYHPYTLYFDHPVMLRELVNSDYIHYGGTGDINEAKIISRPCGDKWAADIQLAPFGSCIFRVIPDL